MEPWRARGASPAKNVIRANGCAPRQASAPHPRRSARLPVAHADLADGARLDGAATSTVKFLRIATAGYSRLSAATLVLGPQSRVGFEREYAEHCRRGRVPLGPSGTSSLTWREPLSIKITVSSHF